MTLLLAPGVPMLLAGDECSRTQLGNNNAYCQDSELSWFDWSLPTENADLLEFTRELIALRRALPRLGSPRLAHSDGGHPRWQERSLVLGFESVAVLVNGESFPVAFTLPAGAWRRTFSTDGPGDNRVVSAPELPPRTIVVLTS